MKRILEIRAAEGGEDAKFDSFWLAQRPSICYHNINILMLE